MPTPTRELLRVLGTPVSALFSAVVAARNTLYDRGVLKQQRLLRPVVSVGNISVGGAGKTPFVILLAGLLRQHGLRVDVLSRGYGRKTSGVLVVDAGGAPSQFGDEPLLIARRLPEVPVIVGESRYQAGLEAERRFQSDLHLLDDGFQHRGLARDFDIVLLSRRDLDDRLLPSGRLREPLCLSHSCQRHSLVRSREISPRCRRQYPFGECGGSLRFHRSLLRNHSYFPRLPGRSDFCAILKAPVSTSPVITAFAIIMLIPKPTFRGFAARPAAPEPTAF